MNDLDRVIAALGEGMDTPVTEDQARAYLDRRGMTAAEFLVEDAEHERIAAAHVSPPVPDPERDPEGYAHYLYMTNPQG
jgi:hypothetical protein